MTIRLEGISKFYGEHEALRPLDLEVNEGEFVTLLGPSGCGKTTILRIIAGLVPPSSGRVLLDGNDITHRPGNQREVGLLFQSYALFPHMTVADNVAFGLRLRRLAQADVQARVEEMLALVSMEEFGGRYPRQLSGGQQQRVALARILAIEPKVLLLDEPLAALDRKLRLQMQLELARLIDEVGITTIFVTHDQDEALALSDRVAVMDRGEIVQYDEPTAIYDYPATPFAASFVGSSNLFRGRMRTEAGRPVFRTDEGSIPLPAHVETDVAEDEVMLLLRPEHLGVTAEHDAEIVGVIRDARSVGDAVMYSVVTEAGLVLQVKTPRTRNQRVCQVGQRVGVSIETEEGCWLIPESQPSTGPPEITDEGATHPRTVAS